MQNPTETERRSLSAIVTSLEREVHAAVALTAMAPDTDWPERRDVTEALLLVRELLADARAKLVPTPAELVRA